MSDKDSIKEAFAKVREDILNLEYSLSSLYLEINQIKQSLAELKIQNENTPPQLTQSNQQTLQQINPTSIPASPADKRGLYDPKDRINDISTGNEGVPADRQTDQQTDRQTPKFGLKKEDTLSRIQKISQMFDSLDSLKKEVHIQFKKLTPQEFFIFSIIYQLEDQGIQPDYSTIAIKTNLTESSIRDYTQKLIKKGVPLQKNKENNKKISLFITPEFRRLVPLSTLISLRNL